MTDEIVEACDQFLLMSADPNDLPIIEIGMRESRCNTDIFNQISLSFISDSEDVWNFFNF